jgi:hypothetical protein
MHYQSLMVRIETLIILFQYLSTLMLHNYLIYRLPTLKPLLNYICLIISRQHFDIKLIFGNEDFILNHSRVIYPSRLDIPYRS